MTIATVPAATFAQGIRMRLRRLRADEILLIVEGSSDKSALMRWLSSSVHVLPAAGKEQVVLSRDHLTPDERLRCTMIVDCDGRVEPAWLGDDDLIISEMRDLEADLIHHFAVVESLVFEHAWQLGSSKSELTHLAEQLQEFAVNLATVFGIVTDTAALVGVPTRVVDPHSGERRRLRLTDLSPAHLMGAWPEAPSLEKLTGLLGIKLTWTEAQPSAILALEARQRLKLCRAHTAPACIPCTARRFANGHDIIDALWLGFQALGVADLESDALAREVRLAATGGTDMWAVLRRLKARGSATGYSVLAQ